MPDDRGHLLTEQQNPRSADIDRAPLAEAFDIMNEEDGSVAQAVRAAKPQICEAITLVVEAFKRSGRLLYVGAGTSGRLGVMDAAECPPTFMSPPEMVQGIIAGGDQALRRSVEGAEDLDHEGVQAVEARQVSDRDVVMGIASGGTTRFVHAALAEARRRGAGTIFLACVGRDQQKDQAEVSIRVLTGPEVLSGSTRLKAGTATKMVLNMITTLSMIQLGKVYGNLMVDLNRQACLKLVDRAIRIVQQATGLDRADAQALLEQAGDVKTAIVMHLTGADVARARRLLAENQGAISVIAHGGAEVPGASRQAPDAAL